MNVTVEIPDEVAARPSAGATWRVTFWKATRSSNTAAAS